MKIIKNNNFLMKEKIIKFYNNKLLKKKYNKFKKFKNKKTNKKFKIQSQ